MRALPRPAGRHPRGGTAWAAVPVVAAVSLAAALATWRGSPVVVLAFSLGCALAVTVFVLIRRALLRASVLIDSILCEELDAEAPFRAVAGATVDEAVRPDR